MVSTAELNEAKKLFPAKPCRFAHVKSTGNTVYCWLLCTSLTKITPHPQVHRSNHNFPVSVCNVAKSIGTHCMFNKHVQPALPPSHCRPCIAVVIDMQVLVHTIHCTVHTSYVLIYSTDGPPYLFLKGLLTKDNELKIKSSMGYFWLNVAHVLLSFLATNFSQHLYWDCIQRETWCMRPYA